MDWLVLGIVAGGYTFMAVVSILSHVWPDKCATCKLLKAACMTKEREADELKHVIEDLREQLAVMARTNKSLTQRKDFWRLQAEKWEALCRNDMVHTLPRKTAQ